MKHLNKIVFINSASVRYEEVALDGPIHLAGRSGAGKSTVLRGILYFFTADQVHLGIDSNKDSFNIYYFPMFNSHIVYEFRKDDGTFTVILTKDNHNRVQYAFVDAPYNKEWIIDPVTGSAASAWSEITKNIPQHIDRDLIINIKDYLSILWGCHPDKRYARYSMAICKGYEDILRSQKNVFLNSGFSEAGFKSSIVRALPCEPPTINLQQLRNRLANFEKEVTDMGVWQKIARKEECDVTHLSDDIISDYYKYVESEREIHSILGQLRYALRKAEEDLPKKNERRSELFGKINSLKEIISSIDNEIRKKGEEFAGKIAVKKKELKEIENLKEKYRDIENVRREADTLPVRRKEVESLKEELATRRAQNLDIETKFQKMIVDLQKTHQEILGTIASTINNRKEEDERKKKEATNTRNELRIKTESTFKEQRVVIDEQLKELRRNEKKLIEDKATLNATRLYSDEISMAENAIHELEGNIKSLNLQVSAKKANDTRIQEEAIEKENRIKDDFAKKKKESDLKKGKLEAELLEVESILSRYDDTLYAWLEENKSGWKDSIGKIVDEAVLYRTDLHPGLTETGQDKTVYGVTLSVDGIEARPFTPADYEKRKTRIESEMNDIDQVLRNEAIERDRQIEGNKDAYTKLLREIREEIAKLELQKSLDSTSIEKKKEEIKELKERAAKEKLQRLEKLAEDLCAVSNDITERERDLKRLEKEKDDNLKSLDDNYQKEVSKIDSLFETFRKDRDAEKEAENQKLGEQKAEFEKQKLAELSGNDVDVSKITSLENEIKASEKIIGGLEEKALLVHDYEKVYSEKIVHEQEWQLELQDLLSKADCLQQEEGALKKKKEAELSSVKEEDSRLKDAIETIQKGFEEYEKEKRILSYVESGTVVEQTETTMSVVELLNAYKNVRENKAESMLGLKKKIKSFKVYFKTNVFNLPSELTIDEDFIRYAKTLIEIISFNTIKVYCDGKKDNYIKTLQGVRMSMDGLDIEMEKVKGIISDIDREFRNARLPEVVQEIRVRHADTRDELYDCLISIKEFMRLNEGVLPGVDLWTSQSEYDKVKDKMMDLLNTFVGILFKAGNIERNEFTIEDMFQVEFKVTENGNSSGWESGVHGKKGSDGTDMMIKLMLNIMLISRSIKKNLKDKDFFFHCILDESEMIHASYMRNVIDFCTEREIYLVLGSPMTIDPKSFKHNYELYKDRDHQTHIQLLVGKEDI